MYCIYAAILKEMLRYGLYPSPFSSPYSISLTNFSVFTYSCTLFYIKKGIRGIKNLIFQKKILHPRQHLFLLPPHCHTVLNLINHITVSDRRQTVRHDN